MSKRTERFCDISDCVARTHNQCSVCGRDYCSAHAGANSYLAVEFYYARKAILWFNICCECENKFKDDRFKLPPELMQQFEALRDAIIVYLKKPKQSKQKRTKDARGMRTMRKTHAH